MLARAAAALLAALLLPGRSSTAAPSAEAYSVSLCGGAFQGSGALEGQPLQCIPAQGPGSAEQSLLQHVKTNWPAINTTSMYNFPSALGLLPWIIPMDDPRPDQRGTFRNGGLPQTANLSAHAAVLTQEIRAAIPDPGFSGNCVVDYEDWAPIWPGDGALFGRWSGTCGQGGVWSGPCGLYRNASLRKVKSAHPSWSADEVEAVAKREWEAGATAFMRATLLTARAVRPKCRWGYYGYPPREQCAMAPPGTASCPDSYRNGTEYVDRLRSLNDATIPVLVRCPLPTHDFFVGGDACHG